ncbi:hypothetical protein [Aquibacillus saliphilus]|uniref:hypothetical protein n=1 Tax=Aquibacillus saliphilus TaxID=1909422 RepID=UPI001CF001A1|nr:hypothetical protein [Aquibacillus saliphilus]
MKFLLDFQWEIFILAEVLSFLSLILFGVVRYIFNKRKMSFIFLIFFLVLLILEAALALVIYRETGEISPFQIVIMIFIVYACTFGINDFNKLDRWMKKKVGDWRGVDLLTEKDRRIMIRQKDPKHIAKVNRYSAMLHLLIFVVLQTIFWGYGVDSLTQAMYYITDLSWLGTEDHLETPYPNEVIYGISMIWGIVFIVDFIYSWSYTIFLLKE